MKIAISQRYLPHYRVLFFEQVVSRLRALGHETHLYYGFHIGKVGQYLWASRLFSLRKAMRLGEITDAAIVVPSLFLRLIAFKPNVVVVEDLAGLPNSLMAALYCRLCGKPYLVWGLGNIPGKTPSRLRKLLKPMIDFLYSGASGFICYNKRAAQIYGQTGKLTYVAPNACMPRPSEKMHRAVLAHIEIKYLAPVLKIVCIGELKEQKRLDVLMQALVQLSDLPQIDVDIIGEGPYKSSLVALAEKLGLGKSVHFLGAIFDSARKAEIFQDSALCVLPGRGGLVIQEMMSYGVPVICGTADGTEADFIVTGENGVLLDDATDPRKLAEAIKSFAASSVEQRRRIAHNAHMTIMNGWHVEGMAEAYCNAILAAAQKARAE